MRNLFLRPAFLFLTYWAPAHQREEAKRIRAGLGLKNQESGGIGRQPTSEKKRSGFELGSA